MMRSLAATIAATSLGLAACGSDNTTDAMTSEASAEPATSSVMLNDAPDVAVVAEDEVPPRDRASTPGDAPTYAVVYPGGEVEGIPTIATGPTGPGGLLTFVSDAPPETIIDFYRQRAEAAGLSSVMAMNQGEAKAYGAVQAQDGTQNGASVQVVAAPLEGGQTSVQLSWSAGA